VSEPLAVLRVGMCCPVGLDAAQTASAIRAGVTRKTATHLLDQELDPVVIGHLPDALLPRLASALHGHEFTSALETRMLRLAGPALSEVLGRQFEKVVLPLFVATPQPGAGQPQFVSSNFPAALARQAKLRIHDASRVFADGSTGLFSAIEAARDQLLTPGHAKFVIVGGVDSYLDTARIEALQREGRLRTSGPQDGFTPGEAATFMILATRSVCRRHSLTPLAWITGLAVTDPDPEPKPGALAAACGAALASAHGDPIRLVMAGLNGEHRSAREWGVALIRNKPRFAPELRIEHPAEYVGDAGAALAPLMLGIAALQMWARTLPGPALVWASADSGRRGALIMYPGG
jgi:3-oxoacyl-[acyl-carrier-protein] synthase I